MKRTQIYLTDFDHKKIKEYSNQNKLSFSGGIRELVAMSLRDKPYKLKKKTSFGQELLESRKRFSFNGPKDLSTTIDDYLYRGKKP